MDFSQRFARAIAAARRKATPVPGSREPIHTNTHQTLGESVPHWEKGWPPRGRGGAALTNEHQEGRRVRKRGRDRQATQPVEVEDKAEWRRIPPMACRGLDPEVGADHSEEWGWACRPLVVVGPGEAEVAVSFAVWCDLWRSAAGQSQKRVLQGGEAMSRLQPVWAGRAWSNGTSPRSFFPRIQCGQSGGRGAALQS